MQIKEQVIAQYNNHDVVEYQLIAENGFQVSFLNYGGIIRAIYTPDKFGVRANIVTASKDFDPQNPWYLGAITGRIAGRIANAEFSLNNRQYKLDNNNGRHNLHGGPAGLDKQFWAVSPLSNGAKLSYRSPDNESGFPGMVNFEIDYLIDKSNQLIINYAAYPECETILNLTNHSYFDLSAGKNPLLQELQLDADYYAKLDDTGIVSGIISEVKNSPFDFREQKAIGSDLFIDDSQLKLANGYDHPFILNESRKISLNDPISGRTMEIITDQETCVVYSANFLPQKHSAICLETQAMPNAINWEKYRQSVIYTPDKPYYSHNIWKFGLII